jgi:prepilin-type N-terminal cleavage/methylation domain-containing protein
VSRAGVAERGKARRAERGVTLLELLIVVSLIAIMTGVVYPSIAAGLDGLRLTSTCDSISSFLSSGLNRAMRREQLIELTVSKSDNALWLRGVGYERKLEISDGIHIAGIVPETPMDPNLPRHYLLYPGGAPPRIAIRIESQRGTQRVVSLDPITGVPRIERPPEPR